MTVIIGAGGAVPPKGGVAHWRTHGRAGSEIVLDELHVRSMVAVKIDMLHARLVVITALNVAFGQAPESASRPQFDVASIKPSVPREISRPDQRSYGNPGPGKYVAKNTPLQLIIAQAYAVRGVHIVGGPAWVSSDGYEVMARAEVSPEESKSSRNGNPPMFDQDRRRLQVLLEDRFRLKVHRETRELPIYAVTIAKGGPKLRPPNCVVFDPSQAAVAAGQPRPTYCGSAPYEQMGASFQVTGSGVTMTRLLLQLSNFSDRPLVDRTGYTATFNAKVEWYVEPIRSAVNPNDASKSSLSAETPGPPLLTALEEQLGLRLESTKGPIEVLVIDHVDRPSEN